MPWTCEIWQFWRQSPEHTDWLAQAAKASGNLDLEKLLDMKEAGIEVESFVSEELRLQMYQKEVRSPVKAPHVALSAALSALHVELALCSAAATPYSCLKGCHSRVAVDDPSDAVNLTPGPAAQVASVLSSGTGDFDEERILKELPAVLSLPERRVRAVISGQASDRKRDVLVQAVSMLRQRKLDEVVKCLNNLLACNRVCLVPLVSRVSRQPAQLGQFHCYRKCGFCRNAGVTELC